MSLSEWIRPTMTEAALLPGLAEGGVVLRPYQWSDTVAMFEAIRGSLTELGRWLPWCHRDYSLAAADAFVSSREAAWGRLEEFSFAIVREDNGRLLGGCGLNEIRREHRIANLGYWVRSDSAGRGVGSTAARLLARFGCLQAGLRRIEIVAAAGNLPSQHAAAKAGATREGVLRNRLLLRGESHDAVVFSFVPADFALVLESDA